MSKYFDNKDNFLEPKVSQYGSHMVMTNVHKETRRKYWNIDTKFRDDYDQYSVNSPTYYSISLPQPINDVKNIVVSSIELPISFFNISAANGNNLIKITNTDTEESYVLILPDNSYYQELLKSEMNNALIDLGISADLSFNISNNKSSFIARTGSSFLLEFAVAGSNNCAGVTNSIAEFDKYYVKRKLGWILGFRNIEYTVNSTQITSECLIDLANPRYLYLVVDEFSNGNQNSFISPLYTSILNKNILAKVIMDYQTYGYGAVLPASMYNGYLVSDRRSYTGKINLQRLKVQLVNEYGVSVNLNGMDFSFCVEIEYE